MRKSLPKFIAALAAVSAAFCFSALASPEVSIDSAESYLSEPEGILMSFSYGFDDTAKSGRLIPFDVEIVNNTADPFLGELRIETAGVMEDGTGVSVAAGLRYTYPVELEAGEQGSVTSTISMPSRGGEALLTLTDLSGETVAVGKASLDIDEAMGKSVLIGLLSDTPDKLEYLKNISLSGSGLSTRTVELDPANLPATATGFEQLDILVVSNFDTARIGTDSLRAIEQWVTSGGVILIGTGSDTDDAYLFAGAVDELSVTPLGKLTVNMGIKYSKSDDPDGAGLELSLSEVFAPDGLEVMESDDIAMLTRVQQMDGVIVLAAYDLCDIAAFAAEETGYTEDMLINVLGTARISLLKNSVDSSKEYYDLAKGMAGVSDSLSAGALTPFILIGMILSLTIFGLCIYLRSRGLSIFFHIFVIMAAFLAAAASWLMAVRTRSTGLNLNYAYIREINEEFSLEEGFIETVSPSPGTYRISLADDYEFYPVSYLETDIASAESLIEVGADHSVTVSTEKPFMGVISEFGRDLSSEETGGIEAAVSSFEGLMSADVINNNEFTLSDVSILTYGGLLRLGDIEPHGRISVKDEKLLSYPVGDSDKAAAMLLDTDPDSVVSLRRDGLLKYYLDSTLGFAFEGARLIAFTDDLSEAPHISADKRLNQRGDMLLTVSLDMDSARDGYIWKNCIMDEPGVVSGDYDYITNTVTATAVLEYSLGGDSIKSLYFIGLGADFESDDIEAFNGGISLYNYELGSYDYIGTGEISLGEDEIGQYLSPAHTVIVRFTPADTVQGSRIYLPVPYIVGVEGDGYA